MKKKVLKLESGSNSPATSLDTSSSQIPGTNLSTLQEKVETISVTLTRQQKILELNERSNRTNNIVIVGLEISTEGSDLREDVSTFLKEKLGGADAQISYIKHLGRNVNSKKIGLFWCHLILCLQK